MLRHEGSFLQKYKDSPEEPGPVSLERVREVLAGDYQNVEMALEYLVTNGEISTTFSIFRFAPQARG